MHIAADYYKALMSKRILLSPAVMYSMLLYRLVPLARKKLMSKCDPKEMPLVCTNRVKD